MTPRVLVTGASGFVGRHVLAPLVELGFDVHGLSRSGAGPGAGVVWHEADLLERGAGAALVESLRPTHLLHLAWCTRHGLYWDAQENLEWVERSAELVESFTAAGGARVVVAGTCAEYDWSGDCCDEETPLRPATVYGTSKDALRRRLEQLASGLGATLAWGRVFFAFGPGEHHGRIVATVARGLVEGRPVECTSGRQVRDFLYVQDLAEAFAALVASDVTGTFDIGSGAGVQLADLLQRLEELAGAQGLLALGALPDRKEPQRIVANPERIRRHVGWRPRVSLDEGLRRTLDWWRTRLGSELP